MATKPRAPRPKAIWLSPSSQKLVTSVSAARALRNDNLSLSRLLFYPGDFDGKSRDVVLSVFGMLTHVSSADPLYDANHMIKVGAEGTYTLLSWLAASARLGYVSPTSNVPGRECGIISPRLSASMWW
jgi:hypothetical protein